MSRPRATRAALALPVERHESPRLVQETTRESRTSRRSAGVFELIGHAGSLCDTVAMYQDQIALLPPRSSREAKLGEIAGSLQAGMPPRENPRLNTSLEVGVRQRTAGAGTRRTARQQQLQADRPAAGLARCTRCRQPPRRAGFASACQAFGHRELLRRAAQFRAGDEAQRHGARLTCGLSTTWTRVRPSDRTALPHHRRRRAQLRRRATPVVPDLVRHCGGPASSPEDKVAILSANDPVAFSGACSGYRGLARCGARSTHATRRRRTASCWILFDCTALIYQKSFAPLVDQIRDQLPSSPSSFACDRARGLARRRFQTSRGTPSRRTTW